jgi:hypothetical protein
MAKSCSDVVESLSAYLSDAGYVIHNGNAETGETVTDESGRDWWFTWSRGTDVETGETHATQLDAFGDAMAHWFSYAEIPLDKTAH